MLYRTLARERDDTELKAQSKNAAGVSFNEQGLNRRCVICHFSVLFPCALGSPENRERLDPTSCPPLSPEPHCPKTALRTAV